jgi:hypothetical protein
MEMERKDKSKSLVVGRLLLGTNSPFTRQVVDFRLPNKFKVPQIMSYAGDGDSLDHVENFWAHLDLHGPSDEVACRAFPLTFSGNARDWFRRLAANSINNFNELIKMFLTEFLAFRTRKKPSGYLLRLHQHSNKTLKEFMPWFNRENMAIEDPTEDMVYAALYQGISPKELWWRSWLRSNRAPCKAWWIK